MKLLRSLFAAMALSAVATPAFAQLDANQTTSTDQLKLLSTGPYSPYGLYTGRLLQSIGMPVIDMWCDDFSNRIALGGTYNINVTRFDASVNDLNNRTRFGFANLDNYKKAAYLGSFFAGLTNASDVQDLHFTIWRQFGANPGAIRPGELAWSALLTNGNWANINTKYWFVLSDANMQPGRDGGPRIGGMQEQITLVTPEPSAILLVSTGLLGIVGLAKARRRGKKQD